MRTSFIFLLYRTLQTAALPLLLLYVLWRGFRARSYFDHIAERFGRLPRTLSRTEVGGFWLHAVSVGEVLSSVELIRELASEGPVWISCSTLAGRTAAVAKLGKLVEGVFYAPFDYVWAVRAVLRRLRPSVLIVLETEIWPNLYREARRAGCGLIVVNGRISDKTADRYRSLKWFFSPVLALPDKILAQSAEDRARYLGAGAPLGSTIEGGNLKYDFDPQSMPVDPQLVGWLQRPLWIAASTVGPEYPGDVDEDDAVIASYLELSRTIPSLRLIIAPRKPERFAVVAAKLSRAAVAFSKRSQLPHRDTPVLLLDSVGELGGLFPYADVVFMGGTLADRGGHNILEPASCGKPIIAGPHLENFRDIQRRFQSAEALIEIGAPDQLTAAIAEVLQSPSDVGKRALAASAAERGATRRALADILHLRTLAIPRLIPYSLLKPLGYLLSQLWRFGGRVKQRLTKVRRLQTPVVSIGGIAMGGSGKTPLVLHLARELSRMGCKVGILTRGYKRKSQDRQTILAGGSEASVDLTGDEAQLLLRSGASCIGIGADRWTAGVQMERDYRPDVILLDDGFQHTRLHRDLEIVLLDGLDPLAGGHTFPLGRLREPPTALQRADVVVVTRAGYRMQASMQSLISSYGSSARVFLSTVAAIDWVPPLDHREVYAFCGLANPGAFQQTLREIDCHPLGFKIFPDHHRYSHRQLTELVEEAKHVGAVVLLTTEKDFVNLPQGLELDFPIHWLRIGIRIDESILQSILKLSKSARVPDVSNRLR